MTRASGLGSVLTDDQPWATGTIEDQFTPIYLALATPGKYHGAISPPEVDAMDLSTIAALMGVGEQISLQRRQWESSQGAPDVPMEPKRRPPTTADG